MSPRKVSYIPFFGVQLMICTLAGGTSGGESRALPAELGCRDELVHASFPLTGWVALSVSPQARGIGAVMEWPILGGTRARGGCGITEWFGSKGTQSPSTPSHGQGHLPLCQAAPSPVIS